MRLGPVLCKGIPVEVTCDGPTEASSIALIESRKQDDDVGLTSTTTASRASRTATSSRSTRRARRSLRVKILPKKFFRRYAKTKFRVLLGVERDPGKPWHTSVDSGKVVTVVR